MVKQWPQIDTNSRYPLEYRKECKLFDATSFISGALTYHSMLWVGHALLRIWELRKG